MKRSLRTQMLFQYTAIVIICMVVIPAAISRLLDFQMRRFAEEKFLEDRQEMAAAAGNLYRFSNSWEGVRLGNGANFLRWPIITVTLYDEEGHAVHSLGRGMGKRAHSKDMELMGDSMTPHGCRIIDEPITVGGRVVGHLAFKCMPFNDSREGVFLRRFNRHLYIAMAFMLVTAVIIAFFMAERISRPVLEAAKRARLISEGKYKADREMTSDITEIQTLTDSVNKLASELESQEALRKRLMSDIAHELRNPVTIVKSHLEAFEDGIWEPTPDRIKLTVSETDRLSKLISEVGTLYSIEGENGTFVLENANLSEELERSLITFAPLFANKGVTLEGDIEPSVTAFADMGKLRQAVENLLSNALRYTDRGGKVLLSLKGVSNTVEILVKDSGIGIAKSDLPNIFERFYRADKSRARVSGGMGIGLAIAKAIVEGHGGTISAESKEGIGSTFVITLPKGENKG